VVVHETAVEVQSRDRQRPAVRVPEPAIHTEQDHCLQRHPGGGEYPVKFRGFEHLRSLLRPFQPEGLLARPKEAGTEPDRRGHQFRIIAVFEHASHSLDDAAQPHRAPTIRHVLPQCREVVLREIGHKAILPEPRHEQVGRVLVRRPSPLRQFTRIEQALLVVQERISQSLDRQGAGRFLRLAAGMQCVFLGEVLVQGRVGIVPRAEVD
jgi:hypothetical protein